MIHAISYLEKFTNASSIFSEVDFQSSSLSTEDGQYSQDAADVT